MKSIEKSKLIMSMATRDFLSQNAVMTATLPNFTASFTSLQNIITQIQAIAQLQDIEKTGIADSKESLKNTLCQVSADYSRKLVAFANFTNNIILMQEVKISHSKLTHLPGVDLKTKSQALYDRAQLHLAALTNYGITAATQTNYLAVINAFNTAIPKPRLGIDERKQATQQIAALFRSLQTTLDNLDLAIDIIKLTQVNFYNGYRSARKLILTGKDSISVKAKVCDAATGEPVKSATLTFMQVKQKTMVDNSNRTESSEIVLVKKTAEKGGVMIKSLPEGIYEVKISKGGYTDVLTTIYVNNKEMTMLDVEISKN